jgi:O-antigen ligase
MASFQALSLADIPDKLIIRKDAFRWVILFPLFALAFFRESASDDGPATVIYDKAVGGFRWVDLFLILIIVATVFFMRLNHRSVPLPKQLVKPALLFCAAISFAIVYGFAHGGTNVFFDWRGIALGSGLVLVFGYWIDTSFRLRSAVSIFLAVFAIRAVWVLVNYAFGGGIRTVLIGVRTPLFDGNTLSLSGLAAILGFRFCLEESRFIPKLGYLCASFLGYFLVFTSFRRTFWGELFLASAILVFSNKKARRFGLVSFAVGLLVAAVVVPSLFLDRLKSFNVVEGNEASEYAETNLDHVNDLLDAWDQIQQHPITGLGLGYTYETVRIREWKTESWIVHNAPLHVWLRYGIVGLIAYFWFHLRLFGWIRGFKGWADHWVKAFAQVSFAFLVGQFVMRMGFAPWPYSETQLCIGMAFLVGSLFALGEVSASTEPLERY